MRLLWKKEKKPGGPYRVYRGGSWSNVGRILRASYHGWVGPGDRNFDLGFRLVRKKP